MKKCCKRSPRILQSQTLTKFFRKVSHEIILILITAVYILFVPILVLFFLPIYLFRFIVSQAGKILRPDLDKLIHTRSAVLANDGFPDNPCWNIVVWLTQEGVLDLEKFRRDFLTDHILKKDGNDVLVYPEYQQHLQQWCGFYFWRWDTSFDIQNHIREYDGEFRNCETFSDDTLVQIIKELSWKPWNPTRSPWEFLQIKNYRPKSEETSTDYELKSKSILIFRIHHVIGDGNYLLKLLMGDLCGVNLETVAKPNYVQRNFFQRLIFGVCFWIRAPYQLCKMYYEAYDVNPWHVSGEKFVRPMNASLTEPIPLEMIKEIRKTHGVSFSSVLNSAVAGGIRNMMLEQGIECPKDVHMGVPVPMPGHPQKLRNHFICSFITLPVGTEDPLERLRISESIFQDWRNSSAAMLNFIKVPLVGGLFSSMTRPITLNRFSTCLMSNFPGTPDLPKFQGVKVTDMMFGAGFGPGSNGIGFTVCSCKGHIRLLSAVDPNILKTDALVAKLNEKIIQELKTLHRLKNSLN